jgi:hypothetical protein
MTPEQQESETTMWQAWTNVFIGVWVALAPFVPMNLSTVKFNNMVMGAIAALTSYLLPKRKLWERSVGMIFGIWIFVASLIPALTAGSGYLWNNFGSGILITFAGLFAVRKSQAEPTRLLDVPQPHAADGRSMKRSTSTSGVHSHE